MDPWLLFRRAVRAERKRLGLSQDGAAKRARLTRVAWSDIETGKTADPRPQTIEAIAGALGWSELQRDRAMLGAAGHQTADAAPITAGELALARRTLPKASPEELELYIHKSREADRLNGELTEMERRLK